MADAVRKDHVVTREVERLARAVQFVRELRPEELVAVAAGAVQHHDGVGDMAARVAPWRAERRVVQAQRREGLA